MEQISLRKIQHFMYCSHRWGLCEIEQLWADNMFVAQADIMHERVHDPSYIRNTQGIKTFCGVSVYNDSPEYGLYGVTDCIEAKKTSAEDGIAILGEDGAYELCIVEYKPTKPKDREWNDDDMMQVFAQKLCVDHTFGGDCNAAIYYADVRKRVMLPMREEYTRLDGELKEILAQMRTMIAVGTVPPIPKGQRCSGCSMKDICLPTKRSKAHIRSQVLSMIEEEL